MHRRPLVAARMHPYVADLTRAEAGGREEACFRRCHDEAPVRSERRRELGQRADHGGVVKVDEDVAAEHDVGAARRKDVRGIDQVPSLERGERARLADHAPLVSGALEPATAHVLGHAAQRPGAIDASSRSGDGALVHVEPDDAHASCSRLTQDLPRRDGQRIGLFARRARGRDHDDGRRRSGSAVARSRERCRKERLAEEIEVQRLAEEVRLADGQRPGQRRACVAITAVHAREELGVVGDPQFLACCTQSVAQPCGMGEERQAEQAPEPLVPHLERRRHHAFSPTML